MRTIKTVYCKECGDLIESGHGSKTLQLCNKHYLKHMYGQPRPCSRCQRVKKCTRMKTPLCRNCEAVLFAERYVLEQNERFRRVMIDPMQQRLQEYWHYLVRSYGDRAKPIWEAYYPIDDLLTNSIISPAAQWDELESFRKKQSVRYRAALYAYMEYLSFSGYIEPREKKLLEQAYHRLAEQVPPNYRELLANYISFCIKKRELDRWTILIDADDLRDFLNSMQELTNGAHIGAIQETHIRTYLSKLRQEKSQKTVYLARKNIRDFFKWAKMRRLVFTNPAEKVEVDSPIPCPEGLPIDEQIRLVRRWFNSSTDPYEASIGLLSLLYGMSLGELRVLRMEDLDLSSGRITISSRELPITLDRRVIAILDAYFQQRESIIHGASSEFLFVSRCSYRYNRPVSKGFLCSKLAPAETNLRGLRATCLTEIALSGNVKLLEAMGLTIPGSQPYVRASMDILAAKQLGQ